MAGCCARDVAGGSASRTDQLNRIRIRFMDDLLEGSSWESHLLLAAHTAQSYAEQPPILPFLIPHLKDGFHNGAVELRRARPACCRASGSAARPPCCGSIPARG